MPTRHNEDATGNPLPTSVTPKFELGRVLAPDAVVWAISAADRNTTTLPIPSEY